VLLAFPRHRGGLDNRHVTQWDSGLPTVMGDTLRVEWDQRCLV
jgi:hypothetical protein